MTLAPNLTGVCKLLLPPAVGQREALFAILWGEGLLVPPKAYPWLEDGDISLVPSGHPSESHSLLLLRTWSHWTGVNLMVPFYTNNLLEPLPM